MKAFVLRERDIITYMIARGCRIVLSNFVRIRKQYGAGWFLFQLLFYVMEMPVFGIGGLISRIGGKKGFSSMQFRGYCRNVGFVIGKSRIILRNKPYFYKVL